MHRVTDVLDPHARPRSSLYGGPSRILHQSKVSRNAWFGIAAQKGLSRNVGNHSVRL